MSSLSTLPPHKMAVDPRNFSELPYVALRNVVKIMELGDLINACLIYDSFRAATLPQIERTVLKFKWLILAPGHFAINIVQKDQPKIIIRLCNKLTSGDFVSGSNIKFSRNGHLFQFQCSESEREKLLGNLSQFLLTLIKPEKFNFESNFFMESIFTQTRKFDSFKLSHVFLSVKNARIIFEDIEADVFKLDHVEVVTEGIEAFRLKHRDMSLDCAPWLSNEDLKYVQCESLMFSQRRTYHIQSSDIIDFARSWQSGEFGNLKKLEVKLPYIEERELQRMIIEVKSGLEQLNWVQLRQGSMFMTRNGRRAEISLGGAYFQFSTL